MQVFGMVFSLVPQLVFGAVVVAGLVLVAQRGGGQQWARLARLGLVLMLAGSFVSLVMTGGLASGSLVPFRMGPLYWLVGLLSQLLHWTGIGLLVAAALTGRRAVPPGPQSLE